MAIEKGLYGMPEGIDEALAQNMGEPDAVIEMAIATDEDMPVMVELEDGSVEISFGEEVEEIDAAPFDANLADYLEDNQLEEISGDLCEAVEGDRVARRDWAETYVTGLDVLGMARSRAGLRLRHGMRRVAARQDHLRHDGHSRESARIRLRHDEHHPEPG